MSLGIKGVNGVRAVTSHALSSAQAITFSSGSKPVYIPPYEEFDGGYNLLNRPNRVKKFQNAFGMETGGPVHLKGSFDVLLYKGVMCCSVLGIGIALFSIYRMATGNIKKKE